MSKSASPLADGEKSADRALFIAVIVLLVIYAQKSTGRKCGR